MAYIRPRSSARMGRGASSKRSSLQRSNGSTSSTTAGPLSRRCTLKVKNVRPQRPDRRTRGDSYSTHLIPREALLREIESRPRRLARRPTQSGLSGCAPGHPGVEWAGDRPRAQPRGGPSTGLKVPPTGKVAIRPSILPCSNSRRNQILCSTPSVTSHSTTNSANSLVLRDRSRWSAESLICSSTWSAIAVV